MNQCAVSTTNLASATQLTGATALTGTARQVRGTGGDEVTPNNQTYRFGCVAQFNGGASTPTGQCKVQGSFDNVAWFDIATGSVMTSDDAVRSEWLADGNNQVMPKYIRGVTALAGGTPPTKQVVVIWMASNGDFTLE